METFPVRLGRAVRAARLGARLTQEEVAARSGLHPTYVSLVERGRNNVTVIALVRIAAAVGATAADLVASAEAQE
jgi:transcriptional regulator with XRE-family HTH domain